jgi:6-phosphofructokinase 1
VAQELSRRLHRDVRTVVLGHLQRGGEPTPFDRVLATQFGAHAVRLIHQGQLGQMVCYRPPQIESVPIADAIRQLSRVDPASSAVQAARALGIGFGDCAELASPFAAAAGPGADRAKGRKRAKAARRRPVSVRPR